MCALVHRNGSFDNTGDGGPWGVKGPTKGAGGPAPRGDPPEARGTCLQSTLDSSEVTGRDPLKVTREARVNSSKSHGCCQ